MSNYPYPNPPPAMDLTAPNTIFSLRALSPGMGIPDPGSILIIGDSIINQVPEPYSACGYNVLRFAVNGMRVHDSSPGSTSS